MEVNIGILLLKANLTDLDHLYNDRENYSLHVDGQDLRILEENHPEKVNEFLSKEDAVIELKKISAGLEETKQSVKTGSVSRKNQMKSPAVKDAEVVDAEDAKIEV